MDAFEFVSVEIEPDTIGQVQPIVDGVAAEKCSRANPEIVEPVIHHRIVNLRRSVVRKIVSYRDGIAARHDEQPVSCQLGFAHALNLTRIRGRIRQSKSR